jgi:hypothetical protein
MAAEHLSKIRQVQEWVAKYSHDAGEEFLQLGSALAQCHELSRQTVQVIGNALALTSGSDASSPLFQAQTALSSAVGAISSEVGRYTGVSDELREALSELHKIEALNIALDHTVRPFRYVRLCYGIESAWLDAQSQSEIATLSEAMAAVESRSSNTYEAQAERLAEARRVVVVLAEWVAGRVKALSDASGCTQILLEKMKAVPGDISALTEHLLQGMELIDRKTIELVVSLQADDAVRQNLEHVCAMMDEIASHLTGLSETGDRDTQDEEIYWFVHEASAIQLRQVAEIQRRVEEAGERITTALLAMIERLAEISSEAMALTTSAAETSRQQATVAQLSSALKSLYASFSAAPLNDNEIYGRMEAVQQLTETTIDLAQDMRLLSLNAQIQAAKLNQRQSIAVLGEHARRMSDENLLVAGELYAGLNRLTELMHGFGSDITAVDAVQKSQQTELQVVSHTFAQELSEVSRRVSSELVAVCDQCSTLQQRTLQLLNGIRFIGAAGEGFQTISALLESIVRDTETGLTAELVSDQSRDLLDSCRDKYTMEIEHLLHDGVAVSGVVVASDNAPVGGEFGDNVELF